MGQDETMLSSHMPPLSSTTTTRPINTFEKVGLTVPGKGGDGRSEWRGAALEGGCHRLETERGSHGEL